MAINSIAVGNDDQTRGYASLSAAATALSIGGGGGGGAPALTDVATVATIDGALTVSKHNPIDATSGNRSMTMANGATAGLFMSFEKTDSTTNTVTATLNLRGTPASALSLVWQHETVLLVSKADGSWWPVAGHKTKSSLDAAYSKPAPITFSGTATPVSNATDTLMATAATIPAGSLAAGQMYRIDLDGNFDNIATSGTFTVKIKVNGTSTGAMQIANSQTSGQTLKAWSVSQRLYIEATGSSGSVTATAGSSVQAAAGTFGIPQFTQLAATTVDLSSGLIVTVTVQNSTANGGNITRLLHGTIAQAV